jgi:L-ascorbate metabolism protein UlaG (beta-lactamase superfamily)
MLLLVGCLVAAACAVPDDASPEEGARPPLEITFVANEGVMLECGEHKVLIDALFDKPNPAYAAPPPEMLRRMETGQAPFDGVDVALVTHDHSDHFSVGCALRFLERNPDAVLVAAADAAAAIRFVAEDRPGILERVISVALEPGTFSEREVGGIRLKIFRTLHSGNRESPQNLMYLVDLHGRTVFHEGDSDGSLATFARLNPGQERIEVALVHSWYPTNPDGAVILADYLRAEHVGLFHLPIKRQPEAPAVLEQVAPDYEDIFLLMEPGERKTFD